MYTSCYHNNLNGSCYHFSKWKLLFLVYHYAVVSSRPQSCYHNNLRLYEIQNRCSLVNNIHGVLMNTIDWLGLNIKGTNGISQGHKYLRDDAVKWIIFFIDVLLLLSNGVGLFNGGAYVIFDRKLVSLVYHRTRVFHGEQSGLHFSDSRFNGIQRRLFLVLDMYCVCAIPIKNLLGLEIDLSTINQERK